MRLLLDTCTFLWSAADMTKVSERARAMLMDEGNDLFLSTASVWEIVAKHAMGRLKLAEPPEAIVPKHRTEAGIEPLPLSEEACLMQRRLPSLHRDPFDRMLVCQAIVENMVILTPDDRIRQYPVRTAW